MHTLFSQTLIKKLWNRAANLQERHFAMVPSSDFTFSLLPAKESPFAYPKDQGKERRWMRGNQQNSQKFCADLAWLTPQTKYQSLALNCGAGPAKFQFSHYSGSEQAVLKDSPCPSKDKIFREPLFYGLKIVIKSQKSSIHFWIFCNSKSPSFSRVFNQFP